MASLHERIPDDPEVELALLASAVASRKREAASVAARMREIVETHPEIPRLSVFPARIEAARRSRDRELQKALSRGFLEAASECASSHQDDPSALARLSSAQRANSENAECLETLQPLAAIGTPPWPSVYRREMIAARGRKDRDRARNAYLHLSALMGRRPLPWPLISGPVASLALYLFAVAVAVIAGATKTPLILLAVPPILGLQFQIGVEFCAWCENAFRQQVPRTAWTGVMCLGLFFNNYLR